MGILLEMEGIVEIMIAEVLKRDRQGFAAILPSPRAILGDRYNVLSKLQHRVLFEI